jgi:hypothetical protein
MAVQIGANYCERPFVLNGIEFQAGGCGGQVWITQVSQGGVFAVCTDFSEADQCGVTTIAHCS